MRITSIVFLFLFGTVSIVNAQKKTLTEGKIVYSIVYPGTESDPSNVSMMPSHMSLFIKGNKTRTEMRMGKGMSSITIADSKAKTATTLIDIVGSKYAIKMTSADLDKENAKFEVPQIKMTNETKMVAGYLCKKAIITTKDQSAVTSSTVYFTDAFTIKNANWHNPNFKLIEGVMLEYELNQGSMMMKLSASEIDDSPQDEDLFRIPVGYKEMGMDDFRKQFDVKE